MTNRNADGSFDRRALAERRPAVAAVDVVSKCRRLAAEGLTIRDIGVVLGLREANVRRALSAIAEKT